MKLYDENETLKILKELVDYVGARRYVRFDPSEYDECCYNICKKDDKWIVFFYERADHHDYEYNSLKDLCFALARLMDAEKEVIMLEALTKYFSDVIDLNEQRKKIEAIRDEIKPLEEKKKQLTNLEAKYYDDYFSVDREDYAHLTDLPTYETQNHVLRDYSRLNADEIGRIICELLKKYENKDLVTERSMIANYYYDGCKTSLRFYPVLVIKSPEIKYFDYLFDCFNDSMVVFYDRMGGKKFDVPGEPLFDSMKEKCRYEFPNSKPVVIPGVESKLLLRCSKLKYMLNNFGEVNIYDGDSVPLICDNDTKPLKLLDFSKHEFVPELIYSLAYYQRQHGIERMGVKRTRDVYKRIYKIGD